MKTSTPKPWKAGTAQIDRFPIKRGMDIAVSVAAIVLLSPVLVAAGVFTALLLGRPILYRDRRPGRHGVLFTLYKFRSMTNQTDANGDLLPDDRRLTPAGRFLRNLSIDELPQLWNVLRGDMSLVGPRPLVERYMARYSPIQRRRFEVRPGITGWAQTHGRNAISWKEKFEMDVWYVDHMSFWLDMQILWLTILRVIGRQGINPIDCAAMSEFTGDHDPLSIQSAGNQRGQVL